MIEMEIVLIVLCLLNLALLVVVLLKNKSNSKEDIKPQLKEVTNEITLKIVTQQGELKEHLAKEIGINNEKMLKLYNDFEKSLKESLDKSIKELNEKVDIVVRPEDIKIKPLGEGNVNAKIVNKIFKGIHYQFTAMVGNNEVLIQSTMETRQWKEL